MSGFKLQLGNHVGVSVETVQKEITLPQYIQSKVDFGEVSVCT